MITNEGKEMEEIWFVLNSTVFNYWDIETMIVCFWEFDLTVDELISFKDVSTIHSGIFV